MLHSSEFIHYGAIALAVGITAVGVGFGQGATSVAALRAMRRQPSARDDIFRTAILGIALIETAVVIGIFIAIVLLVSKDVYKRQGYSRHHYYRL